ncbi:aminotransferase class III-fold pyridoxal phosphate-dependent enzyme, partial [Kocuria sp. HSID17582]
GVDLVQEGPEDPVAQRVVAAARDAGFILNATGPATLRLAPPLIITERDVDEFVAALPRLLAAREH